MIWFLQMTLLNIIRTFSCQRDYTGHTLPLCWQLCCQKIVLSDSQRCFELFCSTYQSRSRPYLIMPRPVCIHPTRKLVSSPPKFLLSNFKFQAVTGYQFYRGITSTSLPSSSPSVFIPTSTKPSAFTMVLIRPDFPSIGSAHKTPSFSNRRTRI
jgi:hypothetical protein